MTILVIDDDQGIRSMAEIILTRAGYKVLLANSAQDGIRLFNKARDMVDIVMIDLALEDMSGVDALRHMRLLRSGIPGIISTGYDFNEGGLPDDMKEFTTCLRKPYTASRLLDHVADSLPVPCCQDTSQLPLR